MRKFRSMRVDAEKLTGAILVERHGAGGPKRYINPFPNGKE